MKKKIDLLLAIICLLLSILLVYSTHKWQQQADINKVLYQVIEGYRDSYDELEKQYNYDLSSCYILLESCQNVNKDCLVNNGWNCE